MTPETKVKNEINKYLKTIPNLYSFNFTISGIYSSHLKGLPDIFAIYKGHFIGIEVKAPNKENTQSDMQKIRERQIKNAGGSYILVTSVEQVKEFLEAHFES